MTRARTSRRTIAAAAAVALCCPACCAAAPAQKNNEKGPRGGRPAEVMNPPEVAYAPLLLYDGQWLLKRDGAKPDEKPVTIDNDCVRTGVFVVCEQQVNDGPSTLDVFTAAAEPGRYYAQPLTAKDQPAGRGDLTIDGNLWTFSSEEAANGKTRYYRTTNEFTDKNEKIIFRVEESADGRNWKTTESGVETLLHR